MAVYLGYLQRSAARVLYVFAPLFLSALAYCAWARLTGATVTIVHVMGASIVIGLAMDYTAVSVSADHGDVELSKVLLTGLCTLASFGVLLFARHPVLRDLGAVVSIGCGIALAFALFVRLGHGARAAA
jgi:predicted exporter